MARLCSRVGTNSRRTPKSRIHGWISRCFLCCHDIATLQKGVIVGLAKGECGCCKVDRQAPSLVVFEGTRQKMALNTISSQAFRKRFKAMGIDIDKFHDENPFRSYTRSYTTKEADSFRVDFGTAFGTISSKLTRTRPRRRIQTRSRLDDEIWPFRLRNRIVSLNDAFKLITIPAAQRSVC